MLSGEHTDQKSYKYALNNDPKFVEQAPVRYKIQP
jgi:hypothetical protein